MSGAVSDSWRWVSSKVVLAIHDRQLAEHGGAAGLRDKGAIDSALARPINRTAYGSPDAAELAAAKMFGLAKNHGFVDGNKRTAWVVGRLFLLDNGFSLNSTALDAIRIMEGLAAGGVEESELADWIRARVQDSSRE